MTCFIKKTGLVAAAALLLWSVVAPTAPAGATTHPFDGAMLRGRFIVHTFLGSYAFDTPGGGHTCPSATSVTGEIDDVADEVHGEVVTDTAFVLPVFGGNYVLHTESDEIAPGTWYPTPEIFTGLLLDFTFTVRQLNVPACTLGSVQCSGDMQLEFLGGLVDQDPMVAPPPFVTGDEVFIRASPTRAIDTLACSGIWDVLLPGSVVELKANPGYGDDGAVFEVL